MSFLVIQHWVAPSIAINFGFRWSLPSLLLLTSFFVGDFPLSDIRMMSTVIVYNVICDCLYFKGK